MESLLSAHYGYDVGDARDKMQVLSETQKWLGKEILHVARMKSLLIGPEVLLTWGEVPLSAICKDNIIIDESNSRPLVTVRITDFHGKEYYSYIKHDFSFAEIIARITNLTSIEDFDIVEDTHNAVHHIRFAALKTAVEGEQSWIIQGSCYDHAKNPVFKTCDACDSKREYDLVGALEHLHACRAHTQSSDHLVPATPHEDPCIVWLQNARTAEKDRLFNTLIEGLMVFKEDLERILDVSRELHLFIARPGNRPEEGFNERVGSRGTGNDRDGIPGTQNETRETTNGYPGTSREDGDQKAQEQKRSIDQTEAPALPTSLLLAFENIVALFSVQAGIVLLTSREKNFKGHRNNRVNKAKTRYVSTLNEVIAHIESAREDLILGITAENTSSVRLGAVGAEYIVAMAMANVQRGAFRIGAGSSKVPLSFSGIGGELRRGTRRRAVTWTEDLGVLDAASQKPGHKVAVPTTSLDLIALYAAHARALDFNASLRPKRRAFLAIRALEEELQALKDLNVTQWHCLDNSKRVSDPTSFQVVNRERRARFSLERKVIERAKAERQREHDELLAMLHRAADLRARVKESIEVLDEGHGNAIRVFTLVTLFFLPLSFVTSFFGMNTVDIRDMPQSSWMYWVIAAPITLLVLCSAYLYAYKWEAITRRVTRKTWLDEGIPRRLGGRRRTRRSTLGDYGNGGWRDTWGLRKGETIADVA
ncbi:hypothetical protein CGCSCA4_v010487 [Colletotrichum siamense]|uniref:Uncharacterized protein n=1 Tax=Colletotrichum siamense TaxID=690259 RepID=A0A9P5EMF6_COLSI|nr:hypothetical protein CGCSCA4_v010487 [Colletotrichum siamense]KAF4854523.1 hypothetical protein CGCSCA2_v009619 [Colletotrichum siamense]